MPSWPGWPGIRFPGISRSKDRKRLNFWKKLHQIVLSEQHQKQNNPYNHNSFSLAFLLQRLLESTLHRQIMGLRN